MTSPLVHFLRSYCVNIAWLSCLLSIAGCGEPDTFVPEGPQGGPAGAIAGQLVYSGPLPCTRDGRIVGSAVMMVFDRRSLPPPDGVGRTPVGLSVITGEELFSPVYHQLSFEPDGKLRCPPPDGPQVTVSAAWHVAPLSAGEYHVRGFYDHDGDYNPALIIAQLPTRGDIAGGAIRNLAGVMAGGPVEYAVIGLGDLDHNGLRVIGEAGARVDGVTVNLVLALPHERPLFRFRGVLDSQFANDRVERVVVPSDYPIATFDLADPAGTEESFVRLQLDANLKSEEQALAAASPFFLAVEDAQFAMSREDVDRNGVIDGLDHIPETSLVPALTPLGLLSKLQDGSSLRPQVAPVVVMPAMTLHEGLATTAQLTADFGEITGELMLALRPAVLCIDESQPNAELTLLLARERDDAGRALIEDPEAVQQGLSARFGRPVRMVYGCLPQGRYATNLVYPSGQAWTVPNEAGICAATETESQDGRLCGTRAKLESQSVVIEIGAPTDPVYCEAHPTPSTCLP